MKKQTSKSFYWAMSFIVLTPLMISLILVWVGYDRIYEFETNQKRIANSSIDILSGDIGNIIDENLHLVKLFSQDDIVMIAKLAANPDDLKLREALKKRIKRYFPHSFAFTIADSQGNPLLDDFDGYVGDICIDDMRKMIATRNFAARIHPNPYVYHYDTMTTWEYQEKRGLFFVSFAPETISRLMRAASPAGHRLMLIIKEQDYLMEITEKGARNASLRENYHLTPEERARILAMIPVRDSLWHLVDMTDPDLFSHFRTRTYQTYGLIIFAILTIAFVFAIVLVHFEKRRQQAESMRDEMLSLFSHDLRSPLIGIKGAMELLKDYGATIEMEKKEQLYRLIHDYVIHMGRIVDDILDVHKLESGKMEFHFEQISLSQVLDQAMTMVTACAEQFGVHLKRLDKTETDIVIRADRQRLIRVITNLITNAIKFSPAGEIVTIRINLDNRHAVIAIEDHGPGIPAVLQPYVFQKFVQSRTKQVHNLPSTGLGLTIVKYISEAHGGRVYFDSTTSKGTTFYLELPISRASTGSKAKA